MWGYAARVSGGVFRDFKESSDSRNRHRCGGRHALAAHRKEVEHAENALRFSPYHNGHRLARHSSAREPRCPHLSLKYSGSCLNSTAGFNASFQPNSGGTVWSNSYHGVGGVTPVSEGSFDLKRYGKRYRWWSRQSSALRSHRLPAARLPRPSPSITSPPLRVQIRTAVPPLTFAKLGGTIDSGPNKGLTFTATSANISFKVWLSNTGVSGGISANVYGRFLSQRRHGSSR